MLGCALLGVPRAKPVYQTLRHTLPQSWRTCSFDLLIFPSLRALDANLLATFPEPEWKWGTSKASLAPLECSHR